MCGVVAHARRDRIGVHSHLPFASSCLLVAQRCHPGPLPLRARALLRYDSWTTPTQTASACPRAGVAGACHRAFDGRGVQQAPARVRGPAAAVAAPLLRPPSPPLRALQRKSMAWSDGVSEAVVADEVSSRPTSDCIEPSPLSDVDRDPHRLPVRPASRETATAAVLACTYVSLT